MKDFKNAANFFIQSQAAEKMKLEMLNLVSLFEEKNLKSKVSSSFSDEISIEIAPGEADKVAKILEHLGG